MEEPVKYNVEIDKDRLVYVTFAGWFGEVVMNTTLGHPVITIKQPNAPEMNINLIKRNPEKQEE